MLTLFLRGAIIVIACWFTIGSGVFGLKEASEDASRDVFYRIIAPTYPSSKSPDVVVTLIDNDALGPGGVWPVPYEHYASLFRVLSRLQPSIFFTDIAFFMEIDDKNGLNSFVRELRALHQTGTAIFLSTATDSRIARPIRRELAQLATEGVVTLVANRFQMKGERLVRYKLRADHTTEISAMAIFRAYCQRNAALSACRNRQDLNEFEIWWGARAGEREECGGSGRCTVSSDPLLRLVRLFIQWAIPRKIFGVEEQDPIPLPYHRTVSFEALRNAQVDEAILKSIKGAALFMGTSLALERNELHNPVYSYQGRRSLPDIYAHAMAFDNLVSLEGAVLRDAAAYEISGQVVNFGLLLAATTVTLCVSGLMQVAFGPVRPWIKSALEWLSFIIVAGLLASFLFFQFRLSPANWLGVVVGGFASLEVSDKIVRYLRSARSAIMKWFVQSGK